MRRSTRESSGVRMSACEKKERIKVFKESERRIKKRKSKWMWGED